MDLCAACGNLLPKDGRFCAACGKPAISKTGTRDLPNLGVTSPSKRFLILACVAGVGLALFLVVQPIVSPAAQVDEPSTASPIAETLDNSPASAVMGWLIEKGYCDKEYVLDVNDTDYIADEFRLCNVSSERIQKRNGTYTVALEPGTIWIRTGKSKLNYKSVDQVIGNTWTLTFRSHEVVFPGSFAYMTSLMAKLAVEVPSAEVPRNYRADDSCFDAIADYRNRAQTRLFEWQLKEYKECQLLFPASLKIELDPIPQD